MTLNWLKYRLILIAFLAIVIPSGLLSQTFNDTICIPRQDALKVLAKAKEAKILEERTLLLQQDINLLTQRIKEKEAIISSFIVKDSLNKEAVSTYEDQLQVMRGQRTIFERALKDNSKTIKKLKRKIWWRSAFGLAAIGIGTYFYIIK